MEKEVRFRLDESKKDEQHHFETSILKDRTFANNPNDLLEGISDMFIKADLQPNFAKKNQKVGWDTLSGSILNKLHPSNAIFRQQLNKMKHEKENYIEEQQKIKKAKLKKRTDSFGKFSIQCLSLIKATVFLLTNSLLKHLNSGSNLSSTIAIWAIILNNSSKN